MFIIIEKTATAANIAPTIATALSKVSLSIDAIIAIEAAIINTDFPTSFIKFLFLESFFKDSLILSVKFSKLSDMDPPPERNSPRPPRNLPNLNSTNNPKNRFIKSIRLSAPKKSTM